MTNSRKPLIRGPRRDQLMTLALYDNTIGYGNFMAVGATGAGKSVFLESITGAPRLHVASAPSLRLAPRRKP